jgi:LuxR family transcriptional regulator, maltose regulon positive regulatory protein
VSVDGQDNDPKVLLGYVARALDAVQPVGQLVFDALASPASSVPGSVVPRLGNAFAAMTVPVLLILDDVHPLRNSECRAALSVLADHVPGRGRLVLAGRDQPPLRIARLRAADDDLTGLHRRTEGWAAGLYLAALSVREGGSLPGAAASFGGDDQFVSQYVESELLARISPGQREFLTRAAMLDRKLGVASRNQAVTRARELGLLEG